MAGSETWDGKIPTGGDSLQEDLNRFYHQGDIAWMLVSSLLVFLMIPGVGFFYSGLTRRKSALSLIWLSLMAISVASLQFYFWGYSLAFSDGSAFIGNLDRFALINVLGAPSVAGNRIPELLFCFYQMQFAALTAALAIGAVAERGRMLPSIVFVFVWSTLVYDPIACWTWNPRGWSAKMGGLDFAGGTPVHITSGTTALAFSYLLGKRKGHGTRELSYRPHNVTHVILGTVLIWFGWFGFNGGSTLNSTLRSVMACVVTTIAASAGALTWTLVDYRLERKWSAVAWCSGAISGLVAITPASGFVEPWAAVVFGIVGGAACNFATKLKYLTGCDDALDIFAVHGIGGIVGNLLTGIFARASIAALDGATEIPGGWVDGHYIQLAYQIADSVAGFGYTFVMTCVILLTMNLIPGLSLRASEREEVEGIDAAELGEFAYDFVEKEREYHVQTIDGQSANDGFMVQSEDTSMIDKTDSSG